MRERKFNIISHGEKIDVADLAKNLIEGEVSGKMNYDMTLDIMKTNFNSAINLNFTKGEIANTIYQKQISGVLKLLELQDIFYDKIECDLDIINHIITIKKLNVICPDQVYSISGQYHYTDQNLNLLTDAKFNEEFIKSAPNVAFPFLQQKDNWYYVKLLTKGPLKNLKTERR